MEISRRGSRASQMHPTVIDWSSRVHHFKQLHFRPNNRREKKDASFCRNMIPPNWGTNNHSFIFWYIAMKKYFTIAYSWIYPANLPIRWDTPSSAASPALPIMPGRVSDPKMDVNLQQIPEPTSRNEWSPPGKGSSLALSCARRMWVRQSWKCPGSRFWWTQE